MSDQSSPWWVVLASGAISAIGLWLNARGAWLTTRLSSEERQAQERAQVMASLDARQSAWIARQEQELEKMRLRLEALQADCDRARELARAWHARAHALRHQLDATLPGPGSGLGPRPSLPGLEEIET